MLDAQGPVGTFTGAISLGFCPQTELRRPFCASDDLRYVGGAVQPPKPGRKSSLPKQAGVLAPSARLAAPWSWIDAGDSAKTCSASIERKRGGEGKGGEVRGEWGGGRAIKKKKHQ